MSSKPAPSPEILRSQEEAFIQHYKWLIRWALQFTNNDRARAEDLVQEVFAQFAFAHTDLSAVQNIPAYLYTSLRNMHVSEVRMAGRSHVQSLSIVEYSIADAAMGASDPHALYQTQDELRRVCQYACVRKQSSRAGSVLILRFFHGYHLSEVAEVLGGTCQAVRQCLRFARNEARLFLDDPSALKFISRAQAVNIASSGTVRAAEQLMADLRLAIFRSSQGECLATESLRAFYQKDLILTADTLTLAHVVSCPRCLDGANRELGLPLLAERHPADALGPNNSSRGGPGTFGGTGGAGNDVRSRRRVRNSEGEISSTFLLRCRRRAMELFEHHPRELCVSVNGHLLGSQSVNSEISRLRLDVTIPESLSFIEVMSEENARLLVMTIDAPPDGEPTQARHVALSEGRHIEVTLRYGHPWPMLEVVYEDPNFTAESQLSLSNEERISPLKRKYVSRKRREVAELFNFSRGLSLIRRPVWSRPSFITAIVSMFLIGALLFVRLNITPTVTAASLIERASAAEEMLTRGTDQATHRVINLEERAHAGGVLIARSRIEIWRDTGKDLSVRRVYDEKDHLIAGEWARSHAETAGIASRTIYRRGEAPRSEPPVRNSLAAIRNLELWQLEPSAKDCAEMIGRADTASVSEDPLVYIVSYAGQQTAGDNTVLRATLTLRKSDLHPVEQTLIVQRGTETREYRFVEARFERPPIRSVAPAVFELDPELISEKPKGEGARMKREGDSLPPSSYIHHSTVTATPELEVEVAFLLDQFRARFGDQVNLTRTQNGVLGVKGIVDTEETRDEILHALASVINNPAVRVQISTATEALARQQDRQSDRVIVREFAGSDDAIPLYPELRRYFFLQRDSQSQEKTVGLSPEDDRTDQAVRAFAARVVGRSRRTLSHAIELKQLANRFTASQLDVLSPEARAKWFGMVREHAEALRSETLLLSQELQPIFFPGETRGAEPGGFEISPDADLALAIEHLYKLAAANDEIIRSGFSASSDASATTLVKAPRFRASLATAVRLAGKIRQAATARQ
jgi:RNA polymerase sigma factor (sigma-70 family)